MIKCILFDMGGVLTVDNFDAVQKRIANEFGISFEDLVLLRKKHHENLTLGKYSIRQLVESLKEMYSISKSVDELLKIWKRIYIEETPIIKNTFDLPKKLRKNYSVGLLSNLYDFHTQIMAERGIYDEFVPCIVSNKVGLTKPNKEIYELCLKQTKFKAEECVFIDDREDFILGAQKVGMKTILYKNYDSLINELKNLGVVIE